MKMDTSSIERSSC